MCRHFTWVLVLWGFAFLAAPLAIAKAPRVKELRTQRIGSTTYFHVRFEFPDGLDLPFKLLFDPAKSESLPPTICAYLWARLPRLVACDGKNCDVSYRLPLDFVGKVYPGTTEFLLLYPTLREAKKGDDTLAPLLQQRTSTEVRVALDFRKARKLDAPRVRRTRTERPESDDLEGIWAEAQAHELAVIEKQGTGFGFYGLAREAIGRKYNVPAVPPPLQATAARRDEARRLYEMTTGATALAESLALRRRLNADSSRGGERVHPITELRGIDIAEHPWKEMMKGKKPSAEPLARLVPHDNYYVTFNSVRKLIEFGELSEEWGTNLVAGYEVHSRDHGLKRRYEKQLCLRSSVLGKTLGPALIRGVAVTGSDLYLREGSDVSVIFHVKSRALFLVAVDRFIQEARQEWGKQLREQKTDYKGVRIERFTTPLREVSLHRAAFGDFVVYSNSSAGLRRILDTHAGRGKALADSLDFQYMRTIFRADDKGEDGFAFLSDAFIRQLVGPASKIKEKRRLEALTSLYTLTNGALFCAWETGRLPRNHDTLMKEARLTPDEIDIPEGKGAQWDAARQVVVSDAYNTIHFATPLIELPIDKLTWDERFDYMRFRDEYLLNWRRYFDPVGLRLALKDSEIRTEVYVLPLIRNQEYDFLRNVTGGGTTELNSALFSPRAVFQFTIHLTENVLFLGKAVRDWAFLRVDDSTVAHRWVKQRVGQELGEDMGNFEQLEAETPFTVGIRIGDADAFDDLLKHLIRKEASQKFKYKGITVEQNGEQAPTIYHAKIDGAWYGSLSRDSLHDIIDRSLDRKKKPAKEETVPISSSVYVAPKAAIKAAGALQSFLEWETHKRAVANEPLWTVLYRSGVLASDASPATAEATARQFLGFVPISPDGAVSRYERRTDEVINVRHGSLRRPRLHGSLAAESPLARLLGNLQTVRADLRFREDGIHTILTIARKPPQK